MRILSYLLLAVLLTGCASVFGQDRIPKYTPEEFRFWTRLAEEGNAPAQYLLGGMYYNGQGVPQDYQLAVKWYRKAAEQGEADARYVLGVMYANGEGVPQDYQQAAKWYKLAAERGNAEAQYNLGWLYANGQGVSKDYELAYKWLNLAATQGHKDAAGNRDDIAKKMTNSQISEAEKLSRIFKPISILNGRIETNMGNIEIEFFQKDSPKAVENFRLLADRGYYDGLTFHRVIKGFMIQGGDPKGNGTGGESAWGGQFDDDIDRGSDLYQKGYRRGIIAMANSGPNTNGSQFFIMHQDSNLPPNYVIFAKVTDGLTVVDSLAEVQTEYSSHGEMSIPTQPLVIKKVVITP